MAKNFGVEVLISTAKATKELQAAEGQVRNLDRSLANLAKTLKDSNGNLDAAAKSIASIVGSSREAAKASEQLASAKIKEAKAQAESAKGSDAHNLSLARQNQANQSAAASTALSTARTEQAGRAAQSFAQKQQQAAKATDSMGNSLANQRYLLYDVGATYRTLAIAAQALPAASVAVATSYEKNFAQVIRTSGETTAATADLRKELKQMATEIPLTFAELSSIAQIGGQMGIPTEALGKFTDTVAKFVATADGVSIDSATQSFGRMANLFASGMNVEETSRFFEQLGSAISYTADNSVTSEAKISAMLEKLAPIAKAAGLSATEVVAFSSALSSVGLPPEISRGFFTRFFGQMNKDIAGNTDTLQVYNKILGTTTDEFKNMYQNDPSGVLTAIVTELSKMDKISRTKLLGDLGISGVRDIAVLQGLTENLGVLEKAQADTAQAFEKGSYLGAASAGIFNTFAGTLSRVASAFANLGDTLGASVLPVFTYMAQGVIALANGFDTLLNNVPQLRVMLSLMLTFGSIVGTFFALKSAASFVTAGLIGFQHAIKSGVASTLSFSGNLRRMGETMLATKGYTDAQTAAILRQSTGLKALSIANAQGAASTTRLGIAQHRTAGLATGLGNSLKGVGGGILGLVGGPIGAAITAVTLLGAGFLTSAAQSKQAAREITVAFEQSAEAGTKALGEMWANEKATLFTGGTNKFADPNIGKTFGEIAKQIGVGVDDIAKAMDGGSESLAKYRQSLEDSKAASLGAFQGNATELTRLTSSYDIMIAKVKEWENAAGTSEVAANNTKVAQEALGIVTEDVGGSYESATEKVDDYTKSLNDAIAMAFGMVDAQGAVEASLEKLGEGLAKSTSFGTDSGDGRSNLANLQASLIAQATLFQQHVEGNKMTAEQASIEYGNFVKGLTGELVASGVDPAQIQQVAQDALTGVQSVFDGQVVPIPFEADTETLNSVIEEVAGLSNWLESNPLNATMGLIGGDETAQEAYQVVNYISQALDLPFEAVIDAITNPASENSQAVMEYISKITAVENTAVIGADTSAALGNIRNFAVYAQNQISDIQAALINTAGGIPGLGSAIQAGLNAARSSNVLATPAVQAAKANRNLIPTFDGVKRGYDGARKAAGGAGKAAKGAGKAAKKAGGQGKKAGKDLGKAAKEAKKDWDDAEQAISGYASRIGNAFGYVFDKTQGVSVAKDEYYSVLNGIKSRLDAQKQSLKDLRAENKALNSERKVQLNDAANLEKMAKIADVYGDKGKAKQYRDEAKAIKDTAAETKNKIDVNNKEIKVIEKGTGNLRGYSQAAIDNRAELRNLEKASLGVAEAYAKSGASAKTVKDQTVIWTGKAKDHSKQLGYSKTDIEKVTTSTQKYIDKLKAVPTTIKTTVTENKTTNLHAKNSTGSGVNAAKKALGGIPSSKTSSLGVKKAGSYGKTKNDFNKDFPSTKNTTIKIRYTGQKGRPQALGPGGRGGPTAYTGGLVAGNSIGTAGNRFAFNRGGLVPGSPPSNPREDNIMASLDNEGLAAIRSGEYIQSQPAVDYYGSDIMDKINKMEIPRYALGGMVGNKNTQSTEMGGVIDLSSETIQDIARLIERDVFLFADSEQLASSVNRGNQAIAQKGGHGVIQ